MSASATTNTATAQDECVAEVRAVINVPLNYEMQIEQGLDATEAISILHGTVDKSIAAFANERFAADCSQGILAVLPGYTDVVDLSAPACRLPDNCFPVRGYVIAQYDPNSLTPSEASASVFMTIASGMANHVARNDPTSGERDIPVGGGVIALVMQSSSIVGGVRSQSDLGGIRGLSPGGKLGVSLGFIALFALLVAAATRHRRRREAWKEEEEFDGTSDDHSNADTAAAKASMMKEIDDVVAGLDIDGTPTQGSLASSELELEVEEQSLSSVDKPARYPVDHSGFPSPYGDAGGNGGEEGFEVSMA